MKEQFENDII